MLPLLKKYISAVAKKPPVSKCFKQVSETLKDNILAAKLGFLQSVAMQLEPFLTEYQTNVPMQGRKNHKTLSSINIIFAASAVCKNAQKVEVLKFKEECLEFLQHFCAKLTVKSPLQYKFVKDATCLDLEVILNESQRRSRVSNALEISVEKHPISPSVADVVKREYLKFCEKK